MIVTETYDLNGITFTRTYSNAGYQVERDGCLYDEANDPASFGRTYTESTTPIGGESELTGDEVLSALEDIL